LFPDKTLTFTNEVDNKPATSHVSLLEYDDVTKTSLVQVNIETGRKHQIRLHLSGAGFPIIGDRQYGQQDDSQDLQLTAFKLEFTSPVDGEAKKYILTEELQPRIKN